MNTKLRRLWSIALSPILFTTVALGQTVPDCEKNIKKNTICESESVEASVVGGDKSNGLLLGGSHIIHEEDYHYLELKGSLGVQNGERIGSFKVRGNNASPDNGFNIGMLAEGELNSAEALARLGWSYRFLRDNGNTFVQAHAGYYDFRELENVGPMVMVGGGIETTRSLMNGMIRVQGALEGSLLAEGEDETTSRTGHRLAGSLAGEARLGDSNWYLAGKAITSRAELKPVDGVDLPPITVDNTRVELGGKYYLPITAKKAR